ncbi:MAG: glycosyltransferase family 39 protein [Terriglobales bacterium]
MASTPLAQRQVSRGTGRWALGALLALTLLTRVWILRPTEGEPDSALFSLGAWQWLRHGAGAARIYDRWFSAGYYALADLLLRLSHAHLAQVSGVLDGVSLAAALATAGLIWALGQRLVSPAAAFWAAVLFLLSPGIWQLGDEPHPEGLGIALILAALYCCLRAAGSTGRREAGWWAVAVAAMTCALSVRGDAILLFPPFLAIWTLPALPMSAAGRWRAGGISLAVLAAGSSLFVALRAALLGQPVGRTQHHALRKIAGYLGHLRVIQQGLPMATALGPAVWLVAALGVVLAWRAMRRGHWWRWIGFALAWSLPGYVFWFAVRGNNVRHVAIYSLPWLWAGCQGWQLATCRRAARRRGVSPRFGGALTLAAILALAVDAIAIPANSNLTLYPSGNVPASFAWLRRREAEMRGLAGRMLAQAGHGKPSCYLGATTSPYVLLYLLEDAEQRGMAWRLAATGPVTRVAIRGAAPITFHDVYSPTQFLAARATCPGARSLEYNAAGARQWFFGREWRWLPFHRRWYGP